MAKGCCGQRMKVKNRVLSRTKVKRTEESQKKVNSERERRAVEEVDQ